MAGLSGRLTGLIILPIALVFGVLGLGLLGLVVFSRVPDFRWNENLLVFWPTDLLWSVTAIRLLVLGRRRVGRLFKSYAVLRLSGLGLLAVAKLAGVMPQDNWAFMACAAGVVVGMAIGGRERTV